MRIKASLKLAEGDKDSMLTGIVTYFSSDRTVRTHVQVEIPISLAPFADGTTKIVSHTYHGSVTDVDCWRFLDVMGNDNKAGKLIDIEFMEDGDE